MAPTTATAEGVGCRRSATTTKRTEASAADAGDDGDAAGTSRVATTGRKHMRYVGVDDDVLSEIVAFVKKQRPSVLSREEKLDILLLQAKLRHEHHAQTQEQSAPLPTDKKKKKRQFNGANATQRVAELLNRKRDLVAKIWSDYWSEGKAVATAAARPAGNYAKKPTLVPHTRAVVSSVHAFVRDRRTNHQRVTARDVMGHLESAGFLAVDRTSSLAMLSTVRSVNRFLNRIGYARSSKRGARSYTLRDENALERDAFLVKMTAQLAANDRDEQRASSADTKRIVYAGESYVLERYARDESSAFDANDEQDLKAQTTATHRMTQQNGKRFCFIAAIVDANRGISSHERSLERDRAHLLEETLVVFEGGSKQTKDFRGMFYHRSFFNWMETLFAALSDRGIENAVIVMENSRLHRGLPRSAPTQSMTKAQMQLKCRKLGIVFEAAELRSMLWNKLERHVRDRVQPVVCEMAAKHGHEVVFSPRAHSELQPIESVFAAVKGEVGQQYTVDTTSDDVLARLEQAFANLSCDKVQQCIDDANERLKELMAHVTELDDLVLTTENEEPKNDDDEDDSEDQDDEGDEPEEESDEDEVDGESEAESADESEEHSF